MEQGGEKEGSLSARSRVDHDAAAAGLTRRAVALAAAARPTVILLRVFRPW